VASGLFGSARTFTELADVVDLPEDSTMALDGPLTIAAWLRLSTTGLHQHILSCDDIFVLWTTTANQYRLADTQANGFTTTAGTAPIGTWHSVVAILTATRGDSLTVDNIRIYIDGAPIGGTVEATWAPGTLRPAPDACLIGAAVQTPSHAAGPFEGTLDELLVFSRALSESEIEAFATRVP
jgi:hypothetical protein